MKRNIAAALLILALASFAVYAADPSPASFDVTTTVPGINLMKITTAQFTQTTPAQFASATAFTGPLAITTHGSQTFNAWLSTMSNSRSGYKVTMTATAMKSSIQDQADAYINYTVTVNTKSITTNNASSTPASIDVITVTSLTALSKQSHKIALTVDQASFQSAVEGSYSGTVTFTYTAT